MIFNTVAVQFVGQEQYNDKEYSFLTDQDLDIGDLVVVDTVNGYKTANVTSKFGEKGRSTKWVVCKVDTEAFAAKLEELKRKQFLITQMEQRLSEVDTMSQFARIAETDETMKKLLDAFNTNASNVKELAE